MDTDAKKEPKKKPDTEVGYVMDVPRKVDKRYEVDRLFREWHAQETVEQALQKGRGLIAYLLRLMPENRMEEAREVIKEDGSKTIKTNVQRRKGGTPDVHYFVTYDSVPMELNPDEFEAGVGLIKSEAQNVKLDGQMVVVAKLMNILDEEKVLSTDYKVGRDSKEKIDEEVEKY